MLLFSISEFAVSTRVLRNSTAAARSNHGTDFVVRYQQIFSNLLKIYSINMLLCVKNLGSRGVNSQSAMHDYDPNSDIIFYSQVAINGVSCYNTKKPFSAESHAIIHRDDNAMIYPSDLNVNMRHLFMAYLC